jgi:hypothetical protein
MTHDYKRHGTTTLFAALSVLDGTVIGRCMQRHRCCVSRVGKIRRYHGLVMMPRQSRASLSGEGLGIADAQDLGRGIVPETPGRSPRPIAQQGNDFPLNLGIIEQT